MLHEQVYSQLKKNFPKHSKGEWWPCGKNRIRIRNPNGNEYIFTYYSDKIYRLETLDVFIKSMVKRRSG